LAKKPEFAGGTLGAEVVGEHKAGSGAGGDGGRSNRRIGRKSTEGEQASGLVEAEARAKLAGGGTDDPAAECGVEGAEAVELDGYCGLGFAGSGRDGAASSADGFAGEEKLGEDAAKFGLPAGLFFAGELGEVGEGLVEAGIVFAEQRHELVADAVAGVGGVGVGGVFAPGLVGLFEEGFDLSAAGVEEGAEDFACPLAGVIDEDYRMDGAEALGPGSAEDFH